MVNNVFRTLWHIPRNAAVAAVRMYQKTLSPDHGPLRSLHPYGYCRHAPTCSQFAMDVLQRRGLIVGSLLTIRRLLTCHPWKNPDEARMRELADRALGVHPSPR